MRSRPCVVFGLVLLLAGVGARAQDAQKPASQQPAAPQEPVEPQVKPLPDVPEAAAGDGLYAPLAVGKDTLKLKVDEYLVLTVGPRALFAPLLPSAIAMAKPNYNYPNDWHQGMQGFGRQYGSRLGTKFAFETARFGTGALLHEDFRYRPSVTKGFFPRIGHAIGYTFVDSGDSGGRRLAVANFASAAAGGFTPNLWLPDGFNDARHGATRTGSRFGSLAIQNVTREFSPEIYKVFKTLHLPFPRLPIPEWWNKDIQVARKR